MDAAEAPPTRYARRGQTSLAYQVGGSGPDLLMMGGALGVLTAVADPRAGVFFAGMRAFSRVITFDQRGSGYSDPLSDGPLSLEERAADAEAVAESVGVDRPFVLGLHDGGPTALMAVAAHPERYAGLILVGVSPRLAWAEDYPQGFDQQIQDWFLERMDRDWGSGFSRAVFAPDWPDDEGGVRTWASLEISAGSPAQTYQHTVQTFATDVRHLLELVTLPTLIVDHRDDVAVPAGSGRYMADRIAGSTLVELPGRVHLPFLEPANRTVPELVRQFVGAVGKTAPTGDADAGEPRRLAAVVFTDIADSTESLTRLGDARWAQLLNEHDAAAGRRAREHQGRLVKTTGDGTLAVFSGPAHAIGYALDLRRDVVALGLEMRAGIHAGEVQERGADLTGFAVHAAARVEALASAGSVFVSRTITDLVAGAGFEFSPRGHHQLKGLPGTWEIFDVVDL